jgi:hypothetical protein
MLAQSTAAEIGGNIPRRTAGAALEWSSLTQWTNAAYRLLSRRASSTRRRQARAHWLALPLVLIETAPAGALQDLLWLIDAPVEAAWSKPPRGARAGTKWEAANTRARNRLDRLAPAAERDAMPVGDNARAANPQPKSRPPRRAALPLDRAALMRDAHKRFADGRRYGLDWSFSQCLKTAWEAARLRAAAQAARF